MNTTTEIKVPKIEDLKAAVKNSCDKRRHEWLMQNDSEYKENYEFHLNLAKSLPIAEEIHKQIVHACETCGYNPHFLECSDNSAIRLYLAIRYSDEDKEELNRRVDNGSNKISARRKNDMYYASMKSKIFGPIVDAYKESGYKLKISEFKFNLDSFIFTVEFDPNIGSDELY